MSEREREIRPEKKAMAGEVGEEVAGSLFVILTDCKGMDMPRTTQLRQQLREADAGCRVVKNRLLRYSGEWGGERLRDEWLQGPTALVYGSGDVVEVARILKKFAKEHERPDVKGGLLRGAPVSSDDVKMLADLPPKQVLQGKLVGTLAAPMTQLAGVMHQKVSSLLYVLKAVEDKKKQAGGEE
ncbi:50S ribosomal protein L10 [Kiritimatiella glycovorans]|uniref:Large ribosomal subunit protein uL10 n=1 Tax=Kiritimatiella glycovorans TaxID=1307763 RepID=A0A0G3EJJ4_9BACT|nr:50S ribosomal protein L10 [Kiritimatiella glycovorans]AKJ64965.1 50S ribosomal protein L10 [Kiritimatiella glycovorans]